MRNTDQDFATFNSKNLYDMSFEELEDSIAWKKQFLHMLTKKYGQGRDRNNFMGRWC